MFNEDIPQETKSLLRDRHKRQPSENTGHSALDGFKT